MNLNLLGSLTIYNPYFIVFAIMITILLGIFYLVSKHILAKITAVIWSFVLFFILIVSATAPKSYSQHQTIYDTTKALPMVVDQKDVLVVDGIKLPVTITGKNEVYGLPVSRLTVRRVDAKLKTSNKVYNAILRHNIHRYEIVEPNGHILASYDTKTSKTTGDEMVDTLINVFVFPLDY